MERLDLASRTLLPGPPETFFGYANAQSTIRTKYQTIKNFITRQCVYEVPHCRNLSLVGNPTPKLNITSIGKPVRSYDHFRISKMAVRRHLVLYQTGNSAIRSANPQNPCLEPNMGGSDAPFARYSPINYTVTLKLGFGVTQGHRKRHHSIEHIRLCIRLT